MRGEVARAAPDAPPVRILVDARLLEGGGIGRYLRELLAHWIRSPRVEAVRLLGDPAVLARWEEAERGKAASAVPVRASIECVPWTDPPWSGAAQVAWIRRGGAWSRGCTVAFFPHWNAPAWVGRREPPRVVAVHDLIQFLEPGGYPAWKRALGWPLLRRVVESAAAVVTVSRASARDIEVALPGVEGRLHVIPNGVSEVFRPTEAPPPRPDAPFALVVGALRPHKNVPTALRAAVAAGVELRHVGDPAVRDPALAELLALDPAARSAFRPMGPLPDEALRDLYRGAVALLHPAFREGYGLPVAEAEACGCPVICSDRSSLPEVAGPGAVLLDPADGVGWTNALGATRERWLAGATRGASTRARGWDGPAEALLDVLQSARLIRD